MADSAPETSGEEVREYAWSDEHGFIDKQSKRPHSWNQATSSATIHDLLYTEGLGMPVITIHNPLPRSAFAREELKLIRKGYYEPLGRIALRGLEVAHDILHGRDSETKFEDIDLYGKSLGFNYVMGSALHIILNTQDRNIRSITGQEGIVGPKNIGELGWKYLFSKQVGEPSSFIPPISSVRIPEPLMRRQIDGDGPEHPQMEWRNIKAISRLDYLQGMTKIQAAQATIARLLDTGIAFTDARGVNSSISEKTRSLLPLNAPSVRFIDVRAIKAENPQYADHLINEYVTVSSTIALLGIQNALKNNDNA